jgi:hypothetical protein
MEEIKMIENTTIVKTFTYAIADAYLYQTSRLQKTAEWTYKGPRYLWIFIDENTHRITARFHYTERDNGETVPTPAGMIKVKVDAAVNPDIASLLHNEYIYGDLPHTLEHLPENTTYGHPDPIPPDHTYELTEIEYDLANHRFKKPYPWKKPHMDWETLLNARNVALGTSDVKLAQAPADQRAAWETYRQKLRDLPDTFRGIDPWKVTFPPAPDEIGAPLKTGE